MKKSNPSLCFGSGNLCLATPRTPKVPSGSARTALASAVFALAGMSSPASADTAIGTSTTANLEGAICTAVGSPAPGGSAWTCQVPNASGGFATITGVATNAAGNGPDIPALSALVTANLGANAILIGGTSAKATGTNAISIGGQAIADDSLAIGKGAAAFGNHSVALGESAIAGSSGSPGVASSIAIGEMAKATGDNSIAMGRNTLAIGNQSISIGIQAGLGSSNSIYSTFVGASAGTNSNGAGNTAIAFGAGQAVVGIGNSALGVASGQSVVGDGNVAVGWRSGQNIGVAATPVNNSSAIGYESKATVTDGVALGSSSMANTAAGVVSYVPASATAPQAAAITATQSTLAAVSVGDVATGKFRQINGVAAGTVDSDAVNVSQLKAVTAGAAAAATHYYSVNDGSVAGGNYANDGATGLNSLAAGVGATAGSGSALALGNGASASGLRSTAMGFGAAASGGNTVALSSQAMALGENEVSVGVFAGLTSVPVKTAGDTAYGVNNHLGQVNIGSGAGRDVAGISGVYVGGNAGQQSTGEQNVAVGNNSGRSSTGDLNTAVGPRAGNNVRGSGNVALGFQAGSYIGTPGGIQTNDTVAVGSNAYTNVSNSVALGSASKADTAAGVVGYTPTSATAAQGAAITATTSTLGAVSVGDVAGGKLRQINGVAAGTVDSDAVNVSQLKAVTAGAAAAATHYYSVNDGGVAGGNYANDGATGTNSLAAGKDALAFGNNSVALGRNAIAGVSGTPTVASSIAVGELAKGTGDNSIAIGRNTFAGGDQSISIGIQAGLNSTNSQYSTFVGPSAGTFNSGRANTAIGFGAGQSVTGEVNTAVGATAGQSVVGDANVAIGRRAGQNIGVAATPVNNSSAIGFESKSTVSDGVALGSSSMANTLAGVAGYVPASATAPQAAAITATQSTLAAVSVGDAATGKFRQINGVAAGTVDSDAVNVSQLKAVTAGAAAAATHYYSVNDGGVAGGNYANDGATGANAIAAGIDAMASAAGAVALGDKAKATQAGSVALGAGSVTAAANPTASATVGAFTYGGFAGVSPLSVFSVGAVGAERQITNVAAGRVTATSTDAINGSQLYSVAKGINDRIDALPPGGGGAGPAGPQGPVGPQGPAGVNGVNGSNGVNGTNGINGKDGADADTQGAVMYAKNADNSVNPNEVQLNPDGSGPTTISNVADGKRPNDAVNLSQLNSSLENATNQLRGELNGVSKDANAGIAGAIAMANMPQAFTPGKSMIAAGVGTFKGQSAVSIGVSKMSESGRWVIKFGGSADTRGNVGVGAGAGFQW